LLLLFEPPFGFFARVSRMGIVRATNSWGRAATAPAALGCAAGAGEARAREAKRRGVSVENFIVGR
jgi:hypothetical protein